MQLLVVLPYLFKDNITGLIVAYQICICQYIDINIG